MWHKSYMIGIVVFSFGIRENELQNPCISNVDLALETRRVLDVLKRNPNIKERPLLAVQWEVANVLKKFGIRPDFEIWEHRVKGEYLDSKEVMSQSANYFRQVGVTGVIPVAMPLLHRRRCIQFIREEQFKYLLSKMRTQIRFDNESLQPWTRSKGALFTYALKQLPDFIRSKI